jgi:hypothetical protein
MPVFRVEVETEGREVYYVQAEDEDNARQQVNNDALEPSVSEVLGGIIVNVELADD